MPLTAQRRSQPRRTSPPCYPVASPREANWYGLRKDIDLTFLIDREVIQVAIGVYQVQFHFDQDVCISVQSSFTYSDSQQEWTWSEKGEPARASDPQYFLYPELLA